MQITRNSLTLSSFEVKEFKFKNIIYIYVGSEIKCKNDIHTEI